MYANILEDALTQVKILGETRNELQIAKVLADMPKLLAQKYEVAQPAATDELEGITSNTIYREEYKLDKLAKDREFLKNALLSTYLELVGKESFQFLVDLNKEENEIKCRRSALFAEETKHKTLRRDTVKQLRLLRNHHKAVNYEVDSNIENLKQKLENLSIYTEARTRYVNNWERSRAEQHEMKITNKETPPLEQILAYKRKLDEEERVHSEVILLNNIQMSEAFAKVERIMAKYEEDIEQIDLRIQRMMNRLDDAIDRNTQLKETHTKHKQLMKDWVSFKTEREKARQYQEKMIKSAITVQAWWRGLLVRCQLGPYKPAKKQKGKRKK